jgi:Protein of unknown function (DUF3617)
MKSSKVLLAALLSLGTIGSRADGLPPVKTGNWDMTVTVAGQPGSSVQKVCRSQPTYNPGQSLERMEKAGMTCTRKQVSTQGPVVSMDYLCKLKDTEITSHSDTTFSGESAFHSEVHTRYSSANGGVSDMAMVLDGKWTGPCTEGQTPE